MMQGKKTTIFKSVHRSSDKSIIHVTRSVDIRSRYLFYLRLLRTERTLKEKVETLKRFPLSLTVKIQLMESMGFNTGNARKKYKFCDALANFKDNILSFRLWHKSFKHIEAMYGNGAASFFDFLRSLFLLNLFMCTVTLILILIPQLTNSGKTAEKKMLQSLNFSKLPYKCSLDYKNRVIKRDANSSKFLEFFFGAGWMERSVAFYGFYFPGEIDFLGRAYSVPFFYLLVNIITLFISLACILNMVGTTFKAMIVDTRIIDRKKFSAVTLSSWDYSIRGKATARINKNVIFNNILSELKDREHRERHALLTANQRLALTFVRVSVNIIVVGLVVTAAILIYFSQKHSAKFTMEEIHSSKSKEIIMEFLPAFTIVFLSFILPEIFKMLIAFEDFVADVVVIITLSRIVIVKPLYLGVLIGTLYTILNCSPKNECLLGIGQCQKIYCWETYIGQQFYKLLVMVFFASLCKMLFEVLRSFLVKYVNWKLIQTVGYPEFDIPENVLFLIYVQIIVWLGTLFCPILPAMTTILLLFHFHCKRLLCFYVYKPTGIPYKAIRSRSYFVTVLMFAYLLTIIPIGYCLAMMRTSKNCGPFRKQKVMTDAIFITVITYPPWVRKIYKWIVSSANIGILLVVLVIIIYYYVTLASTRKALNKHLRSEIAGLKFARQILIRNLEELGFRLDKESSSVTLMRSADLELSSEVDKSIHLEIISKSKS